MKSYVFKLKLKIQSVSDGRTGMPTLYKKNFYQMLVSLELRLELQERLESGDENAKVRRNNKLPMHEKYNKSSLKP